jgi:NADH-quinone oxidoreductase subunit K
MHSFIYIQIIFCFALFFLSLVSILSHRRDFLMIVILIEVLLLCSNMLFLFFSILLDDIGGQLFTFFVLTVGAAEAAVGLAIIILYFKLRGNILLLQRFSLKG